MYIKIDSFEMRVLQKRYTTLMFYYFHNCFKHCNETFDKSNYLLSFVYNHL